MTDAAAPRHLGFIGLGIMGAPMAANLLAAGHRLTVWNRTPGKTQPLLERGAAAAASPAALAAAGPEVVFLNVTDTPDVEALLFGPDGLASAARPGLVVVDHSTISPVATQAFARRLRDDHGVTLLDAPVSGGDVGAQNGTLSVMVGGPGEAFAQVRPFLEIVGSRVTHTGASGTGQACKACNQAAVVGALLGVVEAMAVARRSGLDLQTMIEVVSGGAGGSWQLANLGPKIADGDHDPGFMIDYLRKDLSIVADAGRHRGLDLPVLGLAGSLFDEASAEGLGSQGTQALARVYEKRGGFSFA